MIRSTLLLYYSALTPNIENQLFHAIQIEINRALYMNEETVTKSENFDQLARDLSIFTSRLVSIPELGLKGDIPLAAE